jgi:hypothetical protein
MTTTIRKARRTARPAKTPAAEDAAIQPANAPPANKPGKLDILVELLRCKDGASLAEMTAATGWQSHSVRGAMAGALKKRGHVILSGKTGGTRRYRIGDAA